MVFAVAVGGVATAAHAGQVPGGTSRVVAGDEGPSAPKPGVAAVTGASAEGSPAGTSAGA
ncbi:hypothetical protein GCM10010393_16500 [Streptomyces gobitricini]|uniref:Uncharacterized protein n=2 Tax=Streptomyces gobitricini TaxID=68211 RepID=A0ABP5YSH4_9ACTN